MKYFVFAWDHYDSAGTKSCQRVFDDLGLAIEYVKAECFDHCDETEIAIINEEKLKVIKRRFPVEDDGREVDAFGDNDTIHITRPTKYRVHRYQSLPPLQSYKVES